MDSKQAFKMGFVLKLAEYGLSTTDLVDMVALLPQATEKTAAPTALLGLGITGLGMSIAGPMHVGTAAGGLGGKLMDSEVDDLETARKKYLIKRYRDLIDERKAHLNNRAVGRAMRGA